MDGIHDLGGRQGFGPIDVGEHEVPFHHPWEGRAWGVTILTRARGWTIDWWRHVREQIDPADYLTRRYFDQWMQTQAAAHIDSGTITVADLVAAAGEPAVRSQGPPLPASVVHEKVAARAIDYARPIDSPPAFAPGDEVRTRSLGATGHTRLPAYARGRPGVIHAHHGAYLLADAGARGEERAEHLYSVAFAAEALWPEAAGERTRVFLDLWESYLEQP